jgi:hypothetical protein
MDHSVPNARRAATSSSEQAEHGKSVLQRKRCDPGIVSRIGRPDRLSPTRNAAYAMDVWYVTVRMSKRESSATPHTLHDAWTLRFRNEIRRER